MKSLQSIGKNLISLGVFAGLGAVPLLAHADTDGYVEVQLDARAIDDFMRRQLATTSTFCPQQALVDGETTYVDHLAFDHEGELSRAGSESRVLINDFTEVEGREVLYTVPVDVHLKTLECARDPECETTKAVSTTLTYALFTNASSQLCMRSYDTRGLPEGVTPPEVQVCLPFNANGAMKMAGLSGTSASGSAVSMDADGTRVAVRVELGRTQDDYDGARVAAWQDFVDGALERTGADGSWSVFAHQSLILGALERRLASALASQVGLQVDGPITTSWNADGEHAEIVARFAGVLSNPLCPNGIRVDDIVVSGKVRQNDPDAPTGLLTEGLVSYDVSHADAESCGMALGGPIGALVISSLADTIKLDLTHLGPNCQVVGDSAFSCNEPIRPQLASLGPLQATRSSLAGVVTSSAGLAMQGNLKTMGDAFLTMKGAVSSFVHDDVTLTDEAVLRLTGTARLCDATFWADGNGDVGLFQIASPEGNGLPAEYRAVLPHDNAAAYASKPFHVMMTVMTSAGVRTYQLDPVAPAE